MPDFFIYVLLFSMGGLGYGALELMFRAHTHWTMVVVGGLCLCLLYFINTRTKFRIWQKCISGAAIITTVEFVAGCIINIILKLDVWDYAGEQFNLFGQICLHFSLLWLLASALCVALSYVINKYLSRK